MDFCSYTFRHESISKLECISGEPVSRNCSKNLLNFLDKIWSQSSFISPSCLARRTWSEMEYNRWVFEFTRAPAYNNTPRQFSERHIKKTAPQEYHDRLIPNFGEHALVNIRQHRYKLIRPSFRMQENSIWWRLLGCSSSAKSRFELWWYCQLHWGRNRDGERCVVVDSNFALHIHPTHFVVGEHLPFDVVVLATGFVTVSNSSLGICIRVLYHTLRCLG